MNLIVAVARDWAIGREGGMLFHLPGDLKYFRTVTIGKTVLMGRATLESFPGGKPLPNRRNLVLTRDPGYSCPGAEIVHSPAEARERIAALPPDDVFVIGGQAVYELFLDECRLAYVTRVDAAAPADRFFPDLDARPEWVQIAAQPPVTENGLQYRFTIYERRNCG